MRAWAPTEIFIKGREQTQKNSHMELKSSLYGEKGPPYGVIVPHKMRKNINFSCKEWRAHTLAH